MSEDEKFDAFVASLPAKHWSKYDLAAVRLGWDEHAKQCGSEWYTKGREGLYQQVSMWIRRGQDAINQINGIIK